MILLTLNPPFKAYRDSLAVLSIFIISLFGSQPALANECDRLQQDSPSHSLAELKTSIYLNTLSTLEATNIDLIDGKDTRKVSSLMSQDRFKDSVCRAIAEQLKQVTSSPEEVSLFTNRTRHISTIIKIILNSNNFKHTDESSILNSVKLGVGLLFDPKFRLDINVGFGGTTDPINVRVPAYIVAAANMMEQFILIQKALEQENIKLAIPTFRIFTAHHAAIKANAFPKTLTHQRAEELMALVQLYLNRYHPEVQKHTTYVMDDLHFYSNKDILRLQEELGNLLTKEEYKDILESLCKRGKNHGGEDQSTFYGSIHAFIFEEICPIQASNLAWRPVRPNQNSEEQQNFPTGVISVGGETETLFNRVRDALINQVSQNSLSDSFSIVPSVRLVSAAGKVPVYYSDKKDLTVEDVINGHEKEVSSHVKKDLQLIEKDIAARLAKLVSRGLQNVSGREVTEKRKALSLDEATLQENIHRALEHLLIAYVEGNYDDKKNEVTNCLIQEEDDKQLLEPIAKILDHLSGIFEEIGYKAEKTSKSKNRNPNARLVKRAEATFLKFAFDDLLKILKQFKL